MIAYRHKAGIRSKTLTPSTPSCFPRCHKLTRPARSPGCRRSPLSSDLPPAPLRGLFVARWSIPPPMRPSLRTSPFARRARLLPLCRVSLRLFFGRCSLSPWPASLSRTSCEGARGSDFSALPSGPFFWLSGPLPLPCALCSLCSRPASARVSSQVRSRTGQRPRRSLLRFARRTGPHRLQASGDLLAGNHYGPDKGAGELEYHL